MSRFMRLGLVLTLVGMLFAAVAPAVQANPETFDITVKHNINGRSLGLEKELPVVVCVNNAPTLFLEFKDTFADSLPADTYEFEVFLDDGNVDCLGEPVMSLGPVEIPAGVTVDVRARLGAGGAPTLSAKIR